MIFDYHRAQSTVRPAFTMVELIVVISLIAILASAVLVAGRSLVDTARTKNTAATLSLIDDALSEFAGGQDAQPTLTKNAAYRRRYGSYPPDELEVFNSTGIPTASPSTGTLAPSRAEVVTALSGTSNFEEMTFQITGYASDDERAQGNRDLAAMLLAIDLFSESGQMIIDRLPSNQVITPTRADGTPLLFLDRNGNATFDALVDQEMKYVVDNWKVPLSYMSQRDFGISGSSTDTESSNHLSWNQASTNLVKLNGSRPIVFSYGPNGPDQLDPVLIDAGRENPDTNSPATLVDDWAHNQLIDSPLNDDNIYADETLKEKIRRGSR